MSQFKVSRRSGLWASVPLFAFLATACGHEGGGAATDGDDDAQVSGEGGSGGETDGTSGGNGGSVTGGTTGGVEADQGPVGGDAPADMGLLPDLPEVPLPDCQTACDTLFGCAAEHAPFDAATCVAVCEENAGNGARPFRRCIANAGNDCEAVERCRWPDFLGEPDCATTCDAATSCNSGTDLPPGGCDSLCAGNQADAVTECASHVYDLRCDLDDFSSCLGETLPVCASFCAAAPGCGFSTEERCGADCLSQILQEDPLAALRQQDLLACIGRAGADCAAANRCVPQGTLLDRAGFCAQWTACGFDFQFFPCDDALNFIFGGGPFESYAVCLSQVFASGCPASVDAVFQCSGGGAPPVDCQSACESRQVCGLLPEGQDLQACTRDCFTLIGGDPLAAAGQMRLVSCSVFAQSCDELQACEVAEGADARCSEACATQVACGSEPDVDVCEADCVEDFNTAEWQSWLSCVDEAAGCPESALCRHEPPAGCAEFCARRLQCGLEVDADTCVATCVTTGIQNPEYNRLRIACTLSADDCGDGNGNGPVRPDEPPPPVPVPVPRGLIDPAVGRDLTVWNCEFDAETFGRACLSGCDDTALCAGGDDAAWIDCVTGCHDTPEDDSDLSRLAGLACYVTLFTDNTGGIGCNALSSCSRPVDALDCEAHCARLTECGLPGAGPGCVAACADEPLARWRALATAECVEDAQACEDAEVCFAVEAGFQLNRITFCQRWDACDAQWQSGLGCNDVLTNFAPGPNEQACIFALIENVCPAFIDDIFANCFRGGVSQANPACVNVCAAESICAAGDDPDRGDCMVACRELQFAADVDRERAATAYPCVDAGTCVGFYACVEANSPEGVCGRHCDALGACDPDLDNASCVASCRDTFGAASRVAHQACVAAAEGECGAVAACPDPVVSYCDDVCGRLEACAGNQDDPGALRDCILSCEDAASADEFGVAEHAACALNARSCDRQADELGVLACFTLALDGPEDACVSYCFATTTCAGADGFDDCVVSCHVGLPAAEALTLAVAGACLLEAGEVCANLQVCLEGAAEAPVPCEAVCSAVAACELDAAADCMVACESRETSGCVLDAARRPGACRDVATCLALELPPASAHCQSYCESASTCAVVRDAFLCEQTCPEDALVMATRAGCAAVSDCGAFPNCAGLAAASDPDCDAPCDDAVDCGVFAEAEVCDAYCAGGDRSASTPPSYADDVGECLADLGGACDSEQGLACFRNQSRSCENICDILVSCAPGDPGECVPDCERSVIEDPVFTDLIFDCVFEFLDNGICDSDGFDFCTQGAVPQPPDPGEPGEPVPADPPPR